MTTEQAKPTGLGGFRQVAVRISQIPLCIVSRTALFPFAFLFAFNAHPA
jgi:hypothetical protein